MRKRQPDTEAQRLGADVRRPHPATLATRISNPRTTPKTSARTMLIKLLQTDRAFESAEHERAWIVRATGERPARTCCAARDANRRWRSTPSREGGRAGGSRQRHYSKR